MPANKIINHTMTIREELEGLMDRHEPGAQNEFVAEAYISASEFLIWAAEMAATGKMSDGTMSLQALVAAARKKLEEAEQAVYAAVLSAAKPKVAYFPVAAE